MKRRMITLLALLAAAAAQEVERVEESVYVPIEEVLPGEGNVREVVLGYGADDGVVLDSRGDLYSCNRKEGNREHAQTGRGQVIEVLAEGARGRVTLGAAAAAAGVVPGDLLELKLLVPKVARHTILWELAKTRVGLLNLSRDGLYTHFRFLSRSDSPEILDRALDLMRKDIAGAAEYTKDLATPGRGRFKGRAFPEIMAKATREEVLDFLRYVLCYPGKYVGMDWSIAEVFATWVLNGAHGSAEEAAARLDALPGAEARMAWLRGLDPELHSLSEFAAYWRGQAQRLAASERGLRVASYSIEAATLAWDPGAVAWGHFALAFVLARQNRAEECIAAYDEALARFRAIDPPRADALLGANYCLTNRASAARALGRYGPALDDLRAVEEMERDHSLPPRTRAITQRNVAEVLEALSRYDEAIEVYGRAAALYETADDTDGAQAMALATARLHGRLGRNTEAAASYARCAEVCHRMGLRRGEAEAWDKLGAHHRDLGELRLALPAFDKALELRRAIGDRRAEAETLAGLAELHLSLGEHEAAIAKHEEALAARRALGDRAGETDSLIKMGELAEAGGNPRRALGYYLEAGRVATAAQDRERELKVLEATMSLRWTLYEYREAIAICDRLVELRTASEAKDDLAWALRCRGALRGILADFAGALPDLERALALRRETGFVWGQADTLLVLGGTYATRGKWEEARRRAEEALALARTAEDRALVVRCLRDMGNHYSGEYRLAEAFPWYDQALALARHADFNSPSQVATVLNAIGNARLLEGGYDLAKARYTEALALAQGANARGEAINALQGLADAESYLGRLEGARAIYERALGLASEVDNDWACANLRQSLANLFSKLGDAAATFREHDAALAIWADLSNAWGQAAVRSNRAKDRIQFGDYAAATEDLDAAETLARSIGEKQILTAIRFNRAEIHSALGAYAASVAEYEGALVSSREMGHTRFVMGALQRIAAGCRLLGEQDAEQGQMEAAAAQFRKAAERGQEALGLARQSGARLAEGEVLTDLAAVALGQGDLAAAANVAAEAGRLVEGSGAKDALWQLRHLRSRIAEASGDLAEARAERLAAIEVLQTVRASLSGSAVSEEGFLKSKVTIYESMVSLLGRIIAKEPPGEGRLRLVEEAQGFVARARFEVLSRDTSALTAGSGALDAYRRLEGEIARLERERREALGQGNREKADRVTRLIAARDKDLTRELMRLSASDPDMQARLKFDPRVTARAVRAAPEGARLVVYFVGENRLFLWVYDRTGFLEWKEHAIGRKELNVLLARAGDRLQEMVERVGRREPTGKGFGPAAEEAPGNPAWYRENIRALRETLGELYEALIGPVAAHVEAADLLLLLPYGQLNYLPFEALIAPDGAFLGAKKRLAYFTTERHMERTFGRLALPLAPREPHWVGFADPRGKLIDAIEEANAIEALFPRHELYTKATGNATEAQLLKMPADTTVLHFATHGYLNSREPGASFLELAEEGGGAGEGDGRLEACEVLDRFETAPCVASGSLRLVVLAACDTARAQDSPQAELLGMPNEFALAGAPSVVASLWSVYSYTTTDLMIHFYKGMLRDQSDLAGALRAARNEMITKRDGRYAHPFYWAPFLLFGDWR